jgi:tetratricopeptide repeat protein
MAILEPLIEDFERLLGPEHPNTLSSRGNLANACVIAGLTSAAIAIFEPLLADFERLLGPDHRDTLITRDNLAIAYQDVGRSADAERIHRFPP